MEIRDPRAVLELEIGRGASGLPITGITASVNGRPAIKSRERSVEALKPNETVSHSYEVDLDLGENVITAVALNAVSESNPASVRVFRSSAEGEPEGDGRELQRRDLYSLVIGISKYRDERLRLEFGASDAGRVVRKLEAQSGKLFDQVETRLIRDEEATRENILKGLEWLERGTTQRDIAMLYVSGHGWSDEANDYYFLPVNASSEEVYVDGLLWSRFLKAVESISTRAKVVLFLDTCHAGGITGRYVRRNSGLDVTALVREISSLEVGAVVLAAASGRHIAIESPDWGGGAFTTALVAGLEGGADLNGDDVISLKELDFFVSDRVKEMTEGRQHTVSGWPTTLSDFPIAIVGR
jgi:hypothetical protein